MKALYDALVTSPLWTQPALVIVANIAVMLAFVLIVAAVIADFRAYHRQDTAVVSSDRSLVETGTMTAFFAAYYLVMRLAIGEVAVPDAMRQVLLVTGLILVCLGVAFNVWGRVVLGRFWANQIKIYDGHRLLTTGPFRFVRHPLYASLIWTFVGGSFIYANALSLVLVIALFLPMMYVRAKKEDAVLAANFSPEHAEYVRHTWMFVPKPWRQQ